MRKKESDLKKSMYLIWFEYKAACLYVLCVWETLVDKDKNKPAPLSDKTGMGEEYPGLVMKIKVAAGAKQKILDKLEKECNISEETMKLQEDGGKFGYGILTK